VNPKIKAFVAERRKTEKSRNSPEEKAAGANVKIKKGGGDGGGYSNGR